MKDSRDFRVKIQLKNVRIIWPFLFEKEPFKENIHKNGERDCKYRVSFLLDKNNKEHQQIAQQIQQVSKEIEYAIKNKNKKCSFADYDFKFRSLIKDGITEYKRAFSKIDDTDEYYDDKCRRIEYLKNYDILAASNYYPPYLNFYSKKLDRDVDTNPFYAGCYVSAIITIEYYEVPGDSSMAGICAKLHHVMFVGDGEKLNSSSEKQSVVLDCSDDLLKTLPDQNLDEEELNDNIPF